MTSLLVNILLVTGTLVMLLAAIGIVRMPDVYTRMHAASKPAALGITLMMVAAALHFGNFGALMRALLTILFIFLTVPVAAHLLGRAAYFNDVARCKETCIDELAGRHDPRTHELASGR